MCWQGVWRARACARLEVSLTAAKPPIHRPSPLDSSNYLIAPNIPWEWREMAFPRKLLKSFSPTTLRVTTTMGANGPPAPLLPIMVTSLRLGAPARVYVTCGSTICGVSKPALAIRAAGKQLQVSACEHGPS